MTPFIAAAIPFIIQFGMDAVSIIASLYYQSEMNDEALAMLRESNETPFYAIEPPQNYWFLEVNSKTMIQVMLVKKDKRTVYVMRPGFSNLGECGAKVWYVWKFDYDLEFGNVGMRGHAWRCADALIRGASEFSKFVYIYDFIPLRESMPQDIRNSLTYLANLGYATKEQFRLIETEEDFKSIDWIWNAWYSYRTNRLRAIQQDIMNEGDDSPFAPDTSMQSKGTNIILPIVILGGLAAFLYAMRKK